MATEFDHPVVLFLISACFAVALVHPYLLYPLTLRLLPKIRLSRNEHAALPSATMVFCAYNEQASIPAKIANLKAIKDQVPGIQFMAYVDKSTDNTLSLLSIHNDLISIHAAETRTGKAMGMRHLVAASDTDVVIFTDANVLIQPESITRLLAYFSDPSVGGVCGRLKYINANDSPTATVNYTYWELEETIKRLESRSGSTMGADGSIFATRRVLYPIVPAHLLDDFIVSMTVIFSGMRLISVSDVVAFERLAKNSADEFDRKRRIACRAYSSHQYLRSRVLEMSPINKYKYFSHRFVRWYGALSACSSFVFFLLALWHGIGPRTSIAVGTFAALVVTMALRARNGYLSRIGEFIRALTATMLGVLDAWRGKRRQTWEPIKSR